MILHFLGRDFRDHLLYWCLLVIITTVVALIGGTAGLPWLLWVYYIFPSVAEGFILGSTWRTQHQMSRHYLLALPISHKKLFAIQQVRMLVFWIPLLTLVSILPFTTLVSVRVGVFYYFAVLMSIACFMHSQIWSALEMESISTYLPKGYRLWGYIKFFVVGIGPIIILSVGWVNLLYGRPIVRDSKVPFGFLSLMGWIPPHMIFLGALILLIFWIPHNARRWCVTL